MRTAASTGGANQKGYVDKGLKAVRITVLTRTAFPKEVAELHVDSLMRKWRRSRHGDEVTQSGAGHLEAGTFVGHGSAGSRSGEDTLVVRSVFASMQALCSTPHRHLSTYCALPLPLSLSLSLSRHIVVRPVAGASRP